LKESRWRSHSGRRQHQVRPGAVESAGHREVPGGVGERPRPGGANQTGWSRRSRTGEQKPHHTGAGEGRRRRGENGGAAELGGRERGGWRGRERASEREEEERGVGSGFRLARPGRVGRTKLVWARFGPNHWAIWSIYIFFIYLFPFPMKFYHLKIN
jgi:hypothetical protein